MKVRSILFLLFTGLLQSCFVYHETPLCNKSIELDDFVGEIVSYTQADSEEGFDTGIIESTGENSYQIRNEEDQETFNFKICKIRSGLRVGHIFEIEGKNGFYLALNAKMNRYKRRISLSLPRHNIKSLKAKKIGIKELSKHEFLVEKSSVKKFKKAILKNKSFKKDEKTMIQSKRIRKEKWVNFQFRRVLKLIKSSKLYKSLSR